MTLNWGSRVYTSSARAIVLAPGRNANRNKSNQMLIFLRRNLGAVPAVFTKSSWDTLLQN